MNNRFRPCIILVPFATALAGCFIAAGITYMTPKKFESFAVIEIRDSSGPVDVPTEMAKLTSSVVLSRTSHALDLVTRWGVDHQTSVGMLRDCIVIERIPGTDLIRIRARHTDREAARDIASSLVHAMHGIRYDTAEKLRMEQLAKLQDAIAAQQAVVVELRAEVMGGPAVAGADNPTYLESRHDQETDVLMRMKVDAASLAVPVAFQEGGGISMHDDPVISMVPVSPNAVLNLVFGVCAGLLFGFPLAFSIMAMLNRRGSRKGEIQGPKTGL